VTPPLTTRLPQCESLSALAKLVLALPPGTRGAVFQHVVSFRPEVAIAEAFAVGPIRASFADVWEASFGGTVPLRELQRVLEPPVPIGTVITFSQLTITRDLKEVEAALEVIVAQLWEFVRKRNAPAQRQLFDGDANPCQAATRGAKAGHSLTSLTELVSQGLTFPTVYADPPWAYTNAVSRAAAVNHYPTMSVDEICREPVRELAEKNAHLHLWTTNGFLRDAFEVMEAWGFEFKSCLIWVKDEIGMGNYWRVSHEFLLLGVRDSLTFRDRTLPSWIKARRTDHSRKPSKVRELIERASPGPYLELYGREELPNSAWTVYGNRIEKRLF